jgi:hypothetical protein
VAYDEEIMGYLKNTFPDAKLEIVNDRVQVFSTQPRGIFTGVLEKFRYKGAILRDANLEDVFLKLTGRRLRE